MADIVTELPLPLLQLVHLHLLEYPLANDPEYDQNLFNPNVRGLRDRIKSMEDVCYFLVAKVEGRKESARTILPTYPCLAPADTTAFRASLAKYLENVRHAAIYPKSGSVNLMPREKSKGKEVMSDVDDAWWWKDIVVRKSLLEECAGERFEKLLLSLSTHALFKVTSTTNSISANMRQEHTAMLFETQPKKYTSTLTSFRLIKETWDSSAYLLRQRQDDLNTLRNYLAGHSESRYELLSTAKLLSLSDSKFQDLLQDFWGATPGLTPLNFLIELLGLKRTALDPSDVVAQPTPLSDEQATSREETTSALAIQPLPIAAAHHPSILRKLRVPVFNSVTKAAITSTSVNSISENKMHPHAVALLSEKLKIGENNQIALRDAISQSKIIGKDLGRRLSQLKEQLSAEQEARNMVGMTLWEDNDDLRSNVDFNSKFALDLPVSPASDTLEMQKIHIRASLLPAYPQIPEQAPSPQQHPHPPSIYSKPRPSDSSFQKSGRRTNGRRDGENNPGTPRQLITSTPPASVKPRSAYARRVNASQSRQAFSTRGKVNFSASSPQGLGQSRKSIRNSLISARPSLFGPPLIDDEDDAEVADNDTNVDRIIDAIRDDSTSFHNSYHTPKITRLPSPHKSRSASPFKKHNITPGPRPSFKIVERMSLAPLPDGLTFEDDLIHENLDMEQDWTDEDDKELVQNEEDGDYYEEQSVTLRDILLKAGNITQIDSMDTAGLDLVDESFAWN